MNKNIDREIYHFSEFPIEKPDFYDDKEVIKYIGDLPDIIRPSKDELKELLNNRNDSYVRERLLTTYLYKAVAIAADCSKYTSSLTNMDLISQGNISLMEAIDSYQEEFGGFEQYLNKRIRRGIMNACKTDGKIVSIKKRISSDDVYDEMVKIQKIEKDLTEEYGRKPLWEELAYEWLYKGEGYIPTYTELRDEKDHEYYYTLKNQVESLDSMPNIEEVIGIDESIDFDREINQKETIEAIQRVLNSDLLTDIEKVVINNRFGFIDTKTYDELSRMLGLSRERIRQIERTALNKMRQLPYNTLNPYRDETLKRK